ncbi:DUF4184 family protein [Spirillospora sp. NPDC052242]
MPFTLSHAAAVLPLARGPLVPSALVIGSMGRTSRTSSSRWNCAGRPIGRTAS